MPPAADLVITGAQVYTVDAARSWAQAVAIRGGRIVAVGTTESVREQAGNGVEELHLPEHLVVPGFQDAHIHAPEAGRTRLHVELHDLPSRQAYLDTIAAYVRANPEVEWVIGGGWAMEHFPGGLPTKEDLDAIVPDRPVFLFNRDVHGAWVNSVTLARAGITKDTPDPRDGRIERDPVTGEPTGALHEGAAYAINERLLPAADEAEWKRAILGAQDHLRSFGITAWQDAWVTPATLSAYHSLAGSSTGNNRVVGSLWWDRHRGLEQIDEFVAQRAAADGGFFRPTTVKLMLDGVLENFGGAVLEPYHTCDGHGGGSGMLFIEPDVLAAAVTRLDALGFQPHMHAIGDRAVRVGLDAVAAARKANGFTDTRPHMAHLQLVHPDDIPRFRELGVVANCQTYWAQLDSQMEELTLPFLGPERVEQQYPFAELAASGARLAMGSDWAVSTPNPLLEMEVAVERVNPFERDRPAFLPSQRLSVPQALAAWTIGSAYVNHDEHDSGSIEPGKRADLAIIDRNIFDRRLGPIGDASVTHTLVGGEVVYQASSS